MNELFHFDSAGLETLLTTHLPALIGGAALGALLAWALAAQLRARLTITDNDPHGWLRHLPAFGLLALGAFILPLADWGVLPSIVALGLLLTPTAAVMLVRYFAIDPERHLDVDLERRAFLRNAWMDTGKVALGFVAGSALFAFATDRLRDLLHAAIGELVIALPVGAAIGVLLGVGLFALRRRLDALEERRRASGTYGTAFDRAMGSVKSIIVSLLTQFHGTSLSGVLLILAAVLPFTTFEPLPALIVFAIPLLMSATLSGQLAGTPPPDQPALWAHLRRGFVNAAQMTFGYLVGTLALIPLDLVHEWVLDQPDEVLGALNTHLQLTFVALGLSLALGLLGGIASSRLATVRTILTNLGNVGRTIPSLAVLALALPIFGVGFAPSLVALIFIGTLPILINTTVGIMEVSPEIREAARGMGMSDRQVLLQVEIPIAIPVIMAGIRTSAVLVVASATLAGFIGGGGLGALIIRGDGSGRDDILFTGAILATILAIFLEYLFAWLEALLTPRGLRV